MSAPPVISGRFPDAEPGAVLRAVERRATTGVLLFSAPGAETGAIPLRRGEAIADDVASRATLERFLVLTEGTYEVHQRLPALPVSRGDEESREGRLGVHGVTDLLRYCDAAGLTGALFITSDDRHADFLYDAGELVAVRVFGEDGGDVQAALGWDDGGFRIEAWNEMPALPAATAELELSPDDVGAPGADEESELLKVVEVTLSSLLDDRGPAVYEPAQSEQPEMRPPRTDPTVRVIYLGAPGAARRTKTTPPVSRTGGPRDLAVRAAVPATELAPPRDERSPAAPTAAPAPLPEPAALDRARTEPDAEPARIDPTLFAHEAPSARSDTAANRPRTQSYFREAGLVATLALVASALLLLAAIAYPFVLE